MIPELFTSEEIEALSVGITGIPIWKHWDRFCQVWQRSHKSEATIKNVRDAIRTCALHGWLTTIESWQNPDKAFDAMHDLESKRGWSESTFNSYRKNVNTYFLHLKKKKIVSESPLSWIDKMHEHKRGYAIPTKEDIEKIIGHLGVRECTNEMQRRRDQLFVQLLRSTGARPIELLKLTLSNVEDRECVKLYWAKIGGRPRSYPMSASVRASLQDYLFEVSKLGRSNELDRHLFLWVKGVAAWTYSGIRKLLERVNKEAGVVVPITCYSFRRFAATELYRKGMPLERISKFMGHTRTATTMIYIQNLPEVNREAVEMLAGI